MSWTEADVRAHQARLARLAKHSRASERSSNTSGVESATGGASTSVIGSGRAKYGNRKCTWQGQVFDSQHELDCYLGLRALEGAKRITDLKRQQAWSLAAFGTTPDGDHFGVFVCEFVPDFQWRDEYGRQHIGDAKSKITKTQVYRLKKKFFEVQYGIVVEEL